MCLKRIQTPISVLSARLCSSEPSSKIITPVFAIAGPIGALTLLPSAAWVMLGLASAAFALLPSAAFAFQVQMQLRDI